MRLRTSAATLASAAMVLSGVAALSYGSAAAAAATSIAGPHPVAPSIQRFVLVGLNGAAPQAAATAGSVRSVSARPAASGGGTTSIGAAAGRPPISRLAVLTAAELTRPFRLAGVTWTGTDPTLIQVRTRTYGQWTPWATLGVQDDVPDAGTAEARQIRHSSEPLMNPGSDGFQVRVDTASGLVPAGLRLDLIDPGTSPADSTMVAATPRTASSAGAAGSAVSESASVTGTAPAVVSRAQWGADESLRDPGFKYTSTVKVAFIHHTASSNSYWETRGWTMADAARDIRAIYAYSVRSAGYADIPYNFLVDQAGRIYEGRAGGITKAVLSAATGGFNTDSMSVAALGNFDTARPSSALVGGLARIIGWKLGLFHVDPLGSTLLTSSNSPFSRYPFGVQATVPNVSGHRTVDPTACPGRYLYPYLAAIRAEARALQGTQFYAPSVSTAVADPASGVPVSLVTTASTAVDWNVQVTDSAGQVVRTFSGSAKAGRLVVPWNLRDGTGNAVAPGVYTVSLTGSSSLGSASPWSTTITVGTIRVPSATPLSPVLWVPGTRTINGRLWNTTCATVALTLRQCSVRIWGTAWEPFQGGFVRANLWLNNDITNIAYDGPNWTGAFVATPGDRIVSGRRYRTTCSPNSATGPRICYAWILGTVIVPVGHTFVAAPDWLLNNITYLAKPPV